MERGRRLGRALKLPCRIGLVADTHRLLRPEALAWLAGSDLIIHAGDLVTPDALDALGALAPVVAVRGNNDVGDWASALQQTAWVQAGPVKILVVHDLHEPGLDTAGARVVVSGHSHRPLVQERAGTLFVNPGSAGPRRFSLPVTAGELRIAADGALASQIVPLLAPQEKSPPR